MPAFDPTLTSAPSTAYHAAISGESVTKASPADAFRAAQAAWLTGQRLDMSELATSLGISRPTLYKWCGDRNQLLIDVIWASSQDAIATVWAGSAHLNGSERLIKALRSYLELVAGSEPLRAFLTNETDAALRLLTTRGGYQDRLVAAIAERLQEETERSQLQLRAEPALVAYAIVRVIEGFIYNDAIIAVEPQIDSAIAIARLILT
jgi:AcrR family transcriptional regulator